MSTRLERTAYHEAGHAVASKKFGFTCYDLSIKPSESSVFPGFTALGRAKPLDGWWDEPKEVVENYVIHALAGLAAQERFDPSCLEEAYQGAQSDFEQADEIIEYLEGDISDSIRELWIDRARAFVSEDENWRAIRALAEQLLESKTLNDGEIDMIVRYADDPSEMAQALADIRALMEPVKIEGDGATLSVNLSRKPPSDTDPEEA